MFDSLESCSRIKITPKHVLWSKSYYSGVVYILEKESKGSKSIEINPKMKILTAAFMLLFNYLDILPKLYPEELLIERRPRKERKEKYFDDC